MIQSEVAWQMYGIVEDTRQGRARSDCFVEIQSAYELLARYLRERTETGLQKKHVTENNNLSWRGAMRIQDVSRRWFSRGVIYLGGISEQVEIKKSAKDLIPVVAKYPQGRLAGEIAKITERFLFQNVQGRVVDL